MVHFSKKLTPVGAWVRQMLTRAHPNVVVVALAAKLARIAWAELAKVPAMRSIVGKQAEGVLRHGQDYEHGAAMA